jgi:hypothetical protein
VTAISGPVGSGLVAEALQNRTAAAAPGENESGFAVEASVVVPDGLEAWDIFNDGDTGAAAWACEEDPGDPEIRCDQITQTGDIHTAGDTTLAQRGTYLALRNGFPQGRTDYQWVVNLRPKAEGDVGVMFRLEDGGTYYRFSWKRQMGPTDLGYRRLVRSENGVFTPLCEEQFSNSAHTVIGENCTTANTIPNPGPMAYVSGELYQVELVLQGPVLHLIVRELTQGAQTVLDWTVVDDDVTGLDTSLQGSGFALYTARNPEPGSAFQIIGETDGGQISEPPANVQSVEVRQVGPGRGKVVGNVAGLTCSPDCSETFEETIQAIMLTAQPAMGSEFVGWTEDVACAADATNQLAATTAQLMVPLLPGTRCLIAEFAGAPVPPYNLDVNGDGVADGMDGQAVVAYLFGLRSQALQTIGVTPTSTRTEVGALEGYLDQAQTALTPPMLDLDGNGQSDPMSDGLIVQRVLEALAAGATMETLDPNLLTGVVDMTNGTRTTAATIFPYLARFLPPQPSSALTGVEAVGANSTVAEPEPTPELTPDPQPTSEAVTKPGRRKGHEKRNERTLKKRR